MARLLHQGRVLGVALGVVTAMAVTIESVEAQGTIAGRLVDATTQQPLNLAQVSVLGLNLRAVSTEEGTYRLTSVPAGTYTVRAEVLGYGTKSQTVTIAAGQTLTLDFELVVQALQLDRLVVVGYGTRSQATVSGSVSAVTAGSIERNSASTAATALVGRIQGINTRMQQGFEGMVSTASGSGDRIPGDVSDGRPGSVISLQIRNMGSPLFVIDGIPTADPQVFNNLNVGDIESVSILKDASAAVYGFRAANGVVLVETKRGGRDEPPQIRVDGWYGWQNIARYHYADPMNAYDYLFSRVDSNNNLKQPASISKDELELWRIGAPGHESINNWDYVNTPNAPEYHLNASISGGASNAQYYLSVGHVLQTYNYNPDDNKFNRTNLTANLQASLSKALTIGTELKANYELRDEVAVLGATDPIRTFILTVHSSWPNQDPYTGPDHDLINNQVRSVTRSVAILNQDVSGLQQDDRRQASANLWAQYRLPFGMTAKATVSVGDVLRQFDLARKSFTAYNCNEDNTVCNAVVGSPERSRNQLKNVTDQVFGQLTLNYAREFGKHSLSGSGFWEAEGSETTETWTIGVTPTNYSPLFGLTDVQDLGNTWGITRRASVGGRVDYDYQRKYLVTALGRYDGSYLYAVGERWAFFPGVSVGWRLTEEPFLRDKVGFLEELKLRASWGQAGREQGISDWGYLGGATYNVGNGSVFDGSLVTGARPRGLPVTNLSWVTSESSNLGVDFVLFSGKLSGSFDLFQRKLSGLPAPRTDVLVPAEAGYTLPNENLNSDTNRGIEGVLRWSDRIGGMSYSIAPNFTLSRAKNGFRYGERFGNSWDRYRNGQMDRWGAVNFGYQVIGQFHTVEEIENYPVDNDGQGNASLLPGDLIYKDVNGDGVINAMDMRPIGYATTGTPILSFGATLDAAYRRFSLSFVLAGGALYSHNREAATKFPTGHNLPSYAVDRWYRIDPYNPQSEWHEGRYPPFRNGGNRPSFSRVDDFWMTNVRYVRVRRVELGYDVPDALSRRVGFGGLRVYTSVSNPFSIDNVGYYNHDPEVANDYDLVYPTVSVFNVGVRANLGGI